LEDKLSDRDETKNGRIIEFPGAAQTEDDNPDEELRREEARFIQTVNQHKARVRMVTIILLVLAIFAIIYIFVYRASKPYTFYEEIFSENITSTDKQQYANLGDGILQYGLNGASYYSISKKQAWSVVYTMTRPRVEVSGEYAVVFDQNGREAVIFNTENGKCGEMTTNQPITRATISSYGAVSMIVDDGLSNNILFYDKTGAALNIKLHTMISASGYPIDICFSPDGQLLVASFVYIDSGVMQNQIVFYNFDTSINSDTQIVGAFRKYDDTLFVDVAFIGDDRAVACGDGVVVYYSLKNKLKPEEIAVIEEKDTITALTYSKEGVAYATVSGDMVQNRTLKMYNFDGEPVYEKDTNIDIRDMQLTENGLYITGPGTLLYLNRKGRVFYQGRLETSVDKLNASYGTTDILLVGGSRFSYIKLIRE